MNQGMSDRGPINFENIKPGDMIQVQPDDDQGDDKPEAHDEPRWWERS